MMNELYALAVAAFVGPVALDGGDCGVTYTSEGFRPECEESEVYTSKWDSGKTFAEYAFEGTNHTVFYPGGDNNQGNNGNPPPWAGPPDFICPPPFKPCDDDPHDPVYPHPPDEPDLPAVPLPTAVWMLLLAVGSLVGIKKVSNK